MNEIKYINSGVDIVRANVDFGRDDPAYRCFDQDWNEVAQCRNFRGIDGELRFTPETSMQAKGVIFMPTGELELDPEFDPEAHDPQYKLVPSRKGMESDPLQPIWVNSLQSFRSVKIIGGYLGRHDMYAIDVFWIECDEMAGIQ